MTRPVPVPEGLCVRADERERVISVRVEAARAEPGAAKEFLYGVLNACESRYTVLVGGVPPCFLPDAADHFPPRTGPGRRFAACRRCRLKPDCPGAPPGFPRGRAWLAELSPVLAAPNEVVFEVNRRCNLACRMCSSQHLTEELPLGTILRQLAAARRAGVKTARFTGGEPFLHKDILKALRAAKAAGFDVLVNTNATLLGRKEIKAAAPFIDNILVPLQGCDAASDAAATGVPGLFARKLEAARLLRSRVPVLRLGTVISGHLLANFGRYLKLARALGADAWELYRPMAAAARDAAVGPAALRRLASRLEKEIGGRPAVFFANPVPLCLFPRRQAPLFLGARFDDGHTRLVLDPRGFWKPSYYVQDSLGADLRKAWASPELRRLTSQERLPAFCRGCALLRRCLGGSRALAAGGRDPWLDGRKTKRGE